MLDPRVYRAAFLPALFAVVIAAFSLANRPAVVTDALEPDIFNGDRAFGTGAVPARDSLLDLVRRFPQRRPGSSGDVALAARVESVLQANDFGTRRLTTTADGPDGRVELQTVVGVRPGVSSRRIVVLAHRDALARGAVAELSGTAALMEIARLARGQEREKTLVLVSTSGGSIGGKAARQFAGDASDLVDAVVVLGDLASVRTRKPWVVPWSNSSGRAPLELQRVAESAIRREVAADPGGQRAGAQWMRLAVPFAYGEQAELQRAGLAAIAISASGERGPSAGAPVDADRFVRFGRAALRVITALDARNRPPSRGRQALVTRGKVLDGWVLRLLMGAFLLPAIVAVVDALARASRRGQPMGALLGWAALWSVPFMLAWAWSRLLDVIGIVSAPPGPVRPDVVQPDAQTWVAIASAVALLALAFALLRGALRRRDLFSGGAGVALAAALTTCATVTWALNPYATVLLLPAVHGWLIIATGDRPTRRWIAIPVLALGLVPLALVPWYYAGALDLGLGDAAWIAWLAVAGGHVSPLAVLGVSVTLGCFLGTIAVLRAREKADVLPPEQPIKTRGPVSYAGPGSLGGTTSALR